MLHLPCPYLAKAGPCRAMLYPLQLGHVAGMGATSSHFCYDYTIKVSVIACLAKTGILPNGI